MEMPSQPQRVAFLSNLRDGTSFFYAYSKVPVQDSVHTTVIGHAIPFSPSSAPNRLTEINFSDFCPGDSSPHPQIPHTRNFNRSKSRMSSSDATAVKHQLAPGIVLPLTTLRRRRALQYCFTPYHDVDDKRRRRRSVSTSVAEGHVASSVHSAAGDTKAGSVGVACNSCYPEENYEDHIAREELDYYRNHQANLHDKELLLSRSEVRSSRMSNAAASRARVQAMQKQREIANYVGISLEEPEVTLDTILDFRCASAHFATTAAPRALPTDSSATGVGATADRAVAACVNGVDPSNSAALGNHSNAVAGPDAGLRGDTTQKLQPPQPLRAVASMRRSKTATAAVVPLRLEEKDSLKVAPQGQGLPQCTMRRLAYVAPPPPEQCPAWIPVRPAAPTTTSAKDPTQPVTASSPYSRTGISFPLKQPQSQEGRFSPNGGFYIKPTMDDEFICVPVTTASTAAGSSSSRRGSDVDPAPPFPPPLSSSAIGARQPTTTGSSTPMATFRRLSRPNVVSEAVTTQEESRLLKLLATPRRDSSVAVTADTSPIALALGTTTPEPLHSSRSPPRSSIARDGDEGDALLITKSPAVRILDPTVVRTSPPPLSVTSNPSAPQPPHLDSKQLLSLRASLPQTSRSSGCVGAAEVHYWLNLGQQRVPGFKRDVADCVAQVWMRRIVSKECHSARTVLRNYAVKIPDDAVLAVRLRGVEFGPRSFDATVTFAYGDACDDPALAGVADTIRAIVKEASSSDRAKFRGPFLMCSADAHWCKYLKDYCVSAMAREHPEMAVREFPAAHIRR